VQLVRNAKQSALVWVLAALVVLLVGSFLAFRRVQRERDDAKDQGGGVTIQSGAVVHQLFVGARSGPTPATSGASLERVNLPDLVDHFRPILRGQSFEDREIVGPAVVGLMGQGALVNCTFTGTPEALVWVIPDPAVVIGAIAAIDCTFLRCRFVNIAFAATADDAPKLRARLQGLPEPRR
jgi:hypothetical protein